jgi:endonuclease G, mitochondrial
MYNWIISCRRQPARITFLGFLFAALFCAGSARGAALNCPDCEVSDEDRDRYDRALFLTENQKKYYASRHVAYGLPKPPGNATREYLLHQKDYLTWYDDDLRTPLWVAYKLTQKNVAKERERLNCFRRDPRLTDDNVAAECLDYREPTYDQGHLAPNSDFQQTEEAMINTYVYSNMAPQHSNFNQKTWSRLEGLVRMWVEKHGDLYVITGSVFDQNNDKVRDTDGNARRVPPRNRVAIPTHFYKIIFKKQVIGSSDSIAIMLPHENGRHLGNAWVSYVTSHITTIAEIERVTGNNFLPKVTGSKRAEMANHKASVLWAKE